MKLKDEILELVDVKLEEVTRLFEDADRISVNPEDIRRLTEAIPLLQDVKTEVSDIQREVHQLKEKKNKGTGSGDDDDEPPSTDETEPVHDPDVQKLLDGYGKLKRELDNLKGNLKRQQLPGAKPDPDVFEGIRNFYVLWRLWKEFLEDKILDMMKLDDTSLIQSNIVRESDRIIGKLESLKLDLSDCCGAIKLLLQSIKDKLDDCCQAMSDSMSQLLDDTGAIKRALNVLNPDRQADQTLSLEARARATQAAIDALRGLL